MSNQIVARPELCASVADRVPCGHTPDSHYEEAIPADHQVPGGPKTRRGACLCRGCECRGYVAPGR